MWNSGAGSRSGLQIAHPFRGADPALAPCPLTLAHLSDDVSVPARDHIVGQSEPSGSLQLARASFRRSRIPQGACRFLHTRWPLRTTAVTEKPVERRFTVTSRSISILLVAAALICLPGMAQYQAVACDNPFGGWGNVECVGTPPPP